MAVWQTSAQGTLDALAPRLPAMMDRAWFPGAMRTCADFQSRYNSTNAKLQRLLPARLRLKTDDAPPAYEPHTDTDDAKITPKTAAAGTVFVRPLGAASSPDACATSCSSWRNKTSPAERCISFTAYNSLAPKGVAGLCFGHVTLNWFPHPSGGHGAFSGRLKLPCISPRDCSLNGECSSSGTGAHSSSGSSVCVCAAGWKGLRCGELDLLPVDPARVGLQDVNFPSWGGTVWGASKTEWHLYTSETTRKCGLNAWFTNSEVAHGVSSSPFGPYSRTGDVFPTFSTNPSLAQGAPGGRLVMAVAMGSANGTGRSIDRYMYGSLL